MYDVASDTWRAGPPVPEPRGAHAVRGGYSGSLSASPPTRYGVV
jgi:hypothetical protein